MANQVSNTNSTIRSFYEGLGIEGLSNLLDKEGDSAYYNFIVASINPGNILDAGCGYGRVSTPLHKQGYDVVGIDIMPDFVQYANDQTGTSNFTVVNMLNGLPFPTNSFDNVICMWSTFNHFLKIDAQEKVLSEMYRVIKGGGKVIIDVPTPEVYKMPILQEVKTKDAVDNICKYSVNGNPNSDYVHSKLTLTALMESLSIVKYSLERISIGKYPRLILVFSK